MSASVRNVRSDAELAFQLSGGLSIICPRPRFLGRLTIVVITVL